MKKVNTILQEVKEYSSARLKEYLYYENEFHCAEDLSAHITSNLEGCEVYYDDEDAQQVLINDFSTAQDIYYNLKKSKNKKVIETFNIFECSFDMTLITCIVYLTKDYINEIFNLLNIEWYNELNKNDLKNILEYIENDPRKYLCD